MILPALLGGVVGVIQVQAVVVACLVRPAAMGPHHARAAVGQPALVLGRWVTPSDPRRHHHLPAAVREPLGVGRAREGSAAYRLRPRRIAAAFKSGWIRRPFGDHPGRP